MAGRRVNVHLGQELRDEVLQRLVEQSGLSGSETMKRLAYLGYLAMMHTHPSYLPGLLRQDKNRGLAGVGDLEELLGEPDPAPGAQGGRKAPSARRRVVIPERVAVDPPLPKAPRKRKAVKREVEKAPAQAKPVAEQVVGETATHTYGHAQDARPAAETRKGEGGTDWVEELLNDSDYTDEDADDMVPEREPTAGQTTMEERLAGMFPQFDDEE